MASCLCTAIQAARPSARLAATACSEAHPSCYVTEVLEEGAQLCLRFDQIFANVGVGPMELRFPDGQLLEADETNNCDSIVIRLSGLTTGSPAAEILGPGPACSSLEP